MTFNIDNLYYLNSLKNLFNLNQLSNLLYYSLLNDLVFNVGILSNVYSLNNDINLISNDYIAFYLDAQYSWIILDNVGFFLYSTKISSLINFNYYLFYFLKKLFKINLFLFIIYTIFFIVNIENYIKQIKMINYLVKLFILNSTEKEVGPVDDYFFFAVLFMLTISLFIFTSIVLILIQNKIFIWAVGAFFLLTFLILTIPVNLFIDFGIIFCTAIRGSASGNNFLKELIFDIISTTTVFIRFVIQNIRFLFIFSGIFELLEWVFSANNSLFITSSYFNSNVFVVNSISDSFYSLSGFNYLIINSILFVILYFYYILHLLFLLLVQITIYIGVSIWLFFFLYSTKFLNKLDKFFITKKVL